MSDDTPPPTEEQTTILRALRETDDNLMVNALAGTGKTTTLDMIQAASPKKPVLCLAFNKRIADEMKTRFPDTTTVRTLNGQGHAIWSQTVANIKLNAKKTGEIYKEQIALVKGDDKKEIQSQYWPIMAAVERAKGIGYVPEGKYPHARRLVERSEFLGGLEEDLSPLAADFTDALLLASITAAYRGYIDFNDQVYMPALFGGTFPRFPLVLVDEVQDLNPVNHAMLDKLIKFRGVFVGDPYQSIYAFRGAVQSGMERLRTRFSAKELDLSVSFRCPEAIVKNVHWRVPHFKWVKPGGSVEILSSADAGTFPEGSAIICRNNAPLFRTAFHLLASKRSVEVAGSDIGPKVIRQMQRIADDDDIPRDRLLGLITDWETEQLTRTKSPGQTRDLADCMRVFAGYGTNLRTAIAYAKHLFEQQGTIKLLTGHKSKGLEFDEVFHLDPWLIDDSHGEQELNLRYVISTRPKARLAEISSPDIRWT